MIFIPVFHVYNFNLTQSSCPDKKNLPIPLAPLPCTALFDNIQALIFHCLLHLHCTVSCCTMYNNYLVCIPHTKVIII